MDKLTRGANASWPGDRLRSVSSRRQRGVTSIEYALIGTLIGVAIVVGVSTLGDANASMWAGILLKVKTALGLR